MLIYNRFFEFIRHKDIKNNILPGLTIKDLILNSFKEIKANIKLLQDDIKEMKDGLTPVTNQNVSRSVTNNLLKLENEHYELQQYSRKNNVKILGLRDIFNGDHLTGKVVESCNDVGVMIEIRDIYACHRLFQRKVTVSCPKELL